MELMLVCTVSYIHNKTIFINYSIALINFFLPPYLLGNHEKHSMLERLDQDKKTRIFVESLGLNGPSVHQVSKFDGLAV